MKPKYFFSFLLSLFIINSSLLITQATVRFVSKTGSSTPPYTSWETAADSIQKCINLCVDGDTVYVANGVYKENLVINTAISLIGSSMDSTVIDGTGLANITVDFQADGGIKLFTVKGKGAGLSNTTGIGVSLANQKILFCKITNTLVGIGLSWSSTIISHCFIISDLAYSTYCSIDTCNPSIKNSVIIVTVNSPYPTGLSINNGNNIAFNNIIYGNFGSFIGIESGPFFNASENLILNNTVSGFNRNIDGYATDTAIVENNISSYAGERGYTINSKTGMRNNISIYNNIGVVGPTSTNSDYNLYWQNNTNTTDQLAEHDIVVDPMFVKDTIPVYSGTYDYHLQKYSPAIDAGDPGILDADGSRSDIGMYGGPFGESYAYQDLAPREPRNLSAVVDSNYITLNWNRNTEADTSFYKVYRDTVSGFQIDSTKLVSSPTDTFFVQVNPHNVTRYVYKITCVDNQGNESGPSEERVVNITGIENYPQLATDYQLYQNYPNPFNPTTKIGYKLKERGYVKLMVYDIKGELVSVLVNKEQNAGYYEVEFNSEVRSERLEARINLASGIYLYRIEVIGEGRIPVFSDMKKMLMIK